MQLQVLRLMYLSVLTVALSGDWGSIALSAEITINYEPGYTLHVSSDSRAFCKYHKDSGRLELFKVNTVPSEDSWQLQVKGELEQFSVSDAFTCCYFRTSEGLFYCDLQQHDKSQCTVSSIGLPDSVSMDTLAILAVTENVALIRSFNLLALVSPSEYRQLHKGGNLFFSRAVAHQGAMFYSPGEESDLQMIQLQSELKHLQFAIKITSFGWGQVCTPYMRILQGTDDFSTLAGIVSYFQGERCPKGDSLFVWSSFSLIDVDRSRRFSDCVALGTYSDELFAMFQPDDGDKKNTAELVVWQISVATGLKLAWEKTIVIGDNPSSVQLHPQKPIALIRNDDGTRLRILELERPSLTIPSAKTAQ